MIIMSPHYVNGTMKDLLKAVQERMETQIGSLAAKIDVIQERMMAKMDAWIVGTEAAWENWRPIQKSRTP
jgi:hypothetical protein